MRRHVKITRNFCNVKIGHKKAAFVVVDWVTSRVLEKPYLVSSHFVLDVDAEVLAFHVGHFEFDVDWDLLDGSDSDLRIVHEKLGDDFGLNERQELGNEEEKYEEGGKN